MAEVTPAPPAGLAVAPPRLGRLIGLGLGVRFFLDTATQIFAPFLPAMAAGLGVSVVGMGRLLSLRSLTGLLAPLGGALADRFGYRRVLQTTLLMATAGLLLVARGGGLAWIVAGMAIMGVGLATFPPTFHGYLSERLDYERRTRGLGIVEYGWALAGIVGLSLSGLLIERYGWRAPLLLVAAALVAAAVAVQTLPGGRRAGPRPAGLAGTAAVRRSARGLFGVQGLIFFAMVNLMIAHGAWLTTRYGLGPARIGLVALVLGLADLSGSGLASMVGDRLGKRRGLVGAVAAMVPVYALLPLADVDVLALVAGLVVVRFLFEFGFIHSLSLLSEQVPGERGRTLSTGMAWSLLGATAAGLTGPWAFVRWGPWGVCAISAGGALAGLGLLLARVREPGGGGTAEPGPAATEPGGGGAPPAGGADHSRGRWS